MPNIGKELIDRWNSINSNNIMYKQTIEIGKQAFISQLRQEFGDQDWALDIEECDGDFISKDFEHNFSLVISMKSFDTVYSYKLDISFKHIGGKTHHIHVKNPPIDVDFHHDRGYERQNEIAFGHILRAFEAHFPPDIPAAIVNYSSVQERV